jgi:hypothetical protein
MILIAEAFQEFCSIVENINDNSSGLYKSGIIFHDRVFQVTI